MKKFMPLLVAFLFFVCPIFSSKAIRKYTPISYYPSSRTLQDRALEFAFGASYFKTTHRFTHTGSEDKLQNGQEFSKIDEELEARYGFTQKIEVRVGGRYRINHSEDSERDLTTSGFESFYGGIKYSFDPQGYWRFALDLQARHTPYANTSYAPGQAPANEMILGDDGNEFTMGLHIGRYGPSKVHFILFGAYNMPPNNLSHEILFNVELAYPLTNIAMLIGVKGIYTLNQDEYRSNVSEKPQMSTGQTNLFNSINREFALPYIGLNFAFSSLRLELKAGQVVSGVSTDKGQEFLARLVWNSQAGISPESKKIAKFKEYLVEATVIKVSEKGQFLKIDQGMAGDFEKGMKVDIYETGYFGENLLVAGGHIYEVGADWAIVRVEKKYHEKAIKNGFTVRGY